MAKFQEFLNKIYSNDDTMMYFYIILGVIALFFIILIIITSFKEKKAMVNKIDEKDMTNEVKETKLETSEDNEMPKLPEFSILDEPSPDSEEVKEDIEDVYIDVKPEEKPILEDNDKSLEEPKVEEEIVKEAAIEVPIIDETEKEEVEEKKDMDNTFFFEGNIEDMSDSEELKDVTLFEMPEVHLDTNAEDLVNSVEEATKEEGSMSISELMNKDNDFNPEVVEEKEDEEEFELPKIKEVTKEEPKEEEKQDLEKTIISKDLMKERLAKLKNKPREVKKEEEPKDDLENIMKNVGLEDTMVIPGLTDAGKNFLGR